MCDVHWRKKLDKDAEKKSNDQLSVSSADHDGPELVLGVFHKLCQICQICGSVQLTPSWRLAHIGWVAICKKKIKTFARTFLSKHLATRTSSSN